MKRIFEQQYLRALTNMMSLAPGHRSNTIRNYLAPLEKMFGNDFDPIVALDQLIEASQTLKEELQK